MRALFLTLLLAIPSFGCARGELLIKTSPVFTVQITNSYGPIEGLRLLVTTEVGAEIASSVTDTTGVARFQLNKEGSFLLTTDHPEAEIGDVLLDVSGGSPSAKATFQWPETPILATVLVRGRIADGLMTSKSTPLAGATIALLEMVSLRQVGSTTAAEDGSFQFGGVPAGAYFLRVKAKNGSINDPDGDIPIQVDDKAKRDSLSLVVAENDCRLSYDLEGNKAKWRPTVCFRGSQTVPCPY
jgi:hypothetical protein